MGTVLITLLCLGIANGMISLCVTKSKLFEPFRDLFFNRSANNKLMSWVYDLVSCPYCFSHWVAFAMVAIWQPRVTDCGCLFVDLTISAFVLIGLASYAWAIFWRISTGGENK